MDVVRLHANLPTRTAADFEAAFLRCLTSGGIELLRAWLPDVVVTVGQRVAVDIGFAGAVVYRGRGEVTDLTHDGGVHVDVSDLDEGWAALLARRRAARPALLASVPDAFVIDDVPPPAIQHIDLAHREALLARMLAGAGNDDTLDEPASAERSTAVPGMVDLPELDGFLDAAPLARVFDRQSTDIDLLVEVSASDVIALDEAGRHKSIDDANARRASSHVNLRDDDEEEHEDDDVVDVAGADLPSMDAELLDDDHAFTTARPLPAAVHTASAFAPVAVVAAGWTVSRRGTPSGPEHFGWPGTGTRRELAVPAVDSDDDDVFSITSPATADPYAAQDSDPSLNVADIVARNARVADIIGDIDDALFRSSGDGDGDVTHDEMPLPRLSAPPPPALLEMNTSVFHHDSSDERSAG